MADIVEFSRSYNNLITTPSGALLRCSKCDAVVEAGCSCGVEYRPAGARAADAITESPEKSDRAIADEIGVGKDTVRRARKSTGACAPVEKRVGMDGKIRNLPRRTEPQIDPANEIDAFCQKIVGRIDDIAAEFNKWLDAPASPTKDEMVRLAQAADRGARKLIAISRELGGRCWTAPPGVAVEIGGAP